MMRFLRSLTGCSRREALADEMNAMQTEDHAIAMRAAGLRVSNAQFQAQATARLSERAAQTILRLLKEDIDGTR